MTTLKRGSKADSGYVTLSGTAGKGKAHPVYFTPEQVAWLESTFPEPRITPTTTMEEIQNVAGKREIIACIRARVRNMTTVAL